MSAGYFGDRSKNDLKDLFSGLITANHILHHHGVLDAFGQISVRNPDNEQAFFMSHNFAPALVSSAEDIIEFTVEDGSPVKSEVRVGFSERYIHSEIYKRFPTVNSIVHSHSSDVLPFAISGVPLKPVLYTAGFLGTDVPVWDVSSAYSSGDKNDMLVRTTQLGASLAASFSKSHTIAGSVYSTISSKFKGTSLEDVPEPDHPVVLMRGHGFTATARGIEEAVYQAIYTREAAGAQMTGLLMRNAYLEGNLEGTVDLEGSGKIKGGKVKTDSALHYLTTKETADTWSTIQYGMQRPWRLWVREVERSPLYENNC